MAASLIYRSPNKLMQRTALRTAALMPKVFMCHPVNEEPRRRRLPICSSVRRYVMNKSELLVQHYQDTYQLTYQLWQQRNRLFLILLEVVALASLLTYAPETNSILLSWIGKASGITDQDRLAAACSQAG